MRIATALLSILLCTALAFAGQTPGAWIKHNSRDGRYSILMPAEPKLETQDSDASTGEKFKQYLATSADASAVYTVGYFDYTDKMAFSFDRARDGMIQGVKGTLLSENSIKLGAIPGREIKASMKAEEGTEFLYYSRYYDTGRRIYVLVFLHPKSDDGPAMTEKAAKYFDSFQIVTTP